MVRMLKDNVEIGSGYPACRLIYFDSLTDFFREISKHEAKVLNYHNNRKGAQEFFDTVSKVALPLLTTGWQEVLTGLVAAQHEAEVAFAPVRKSLWAYRGNRVDVGRMLVGKPCISMPVKRLQNQTNLVTLVFCGEAWSNSSPESFVTQVRMLLEFILGCEARGKRIEVYLTFGAYSPAGYDRMVENRSYGIIPCCKIKSFSQAPNMLTLSCLGHPSFFRGGCYGMEVIQSEFRTKEITPVKSCWPNAKCILTPAAYQAAFAHIIGKKQAEGMTLIVRDYLIKDLEAKYFVD